MAVMAEVMAAIDTYDMREMADVFVVFALYSK